MAQKAKKDRAKANTASLNSLHIGTLSVHAIFLLFNLLFRRRSILVYIILSVPSLIAEFILESTGRPKYDPSTKALKNSGEDLAAPGLTEYMFDVIWITWASLISVLVFGDWGWLLWAVVPVYGAYKGYGLLGMARGLMGGGGGAQMPEEQQAAQAGNRRQRRAA
ncbi:hypothetical protein GLAREA_04768 [Glarea lozoyensis ATCC 20868]|uniref:DUF788-domain-containing protein n=1 Tax=Glarea lozoyensis (strain ATCC 20868 / MF5171) TaxID=1116229 RepID=S3CNB6_GLAL2|nr:uncharacterized protein GLAREA_04768 [Glarea lozoyensis ATCC 20868]EPE27977.1 hypothetical protein GLAREA_04768 [Glarea lozoyensis ATCC 20868]